MPAAAGREMIRRLENLVGAGQSFAIETTLSSNMYARRIPTWRADGFAIWLYFLEVASADLSVARVAQRVAAGGHGIPEADVRRRHARGIALFPAYRQIADAWYHYSVDQGGPVLVDFQDP
jgi:predicted ABC-type ATPase